MKEWFDSSLNNKLLFNFVPTEHIAVKGKWSQNRSRSQTGIFKAKFCGKLWKSKRICSPVFANLHLL